MVKCLIMVPLVVLMQLGQCCQIVSPEVITRTLQYSNKHTNILQSDYWDINLDNFKLRYDALSNLCVNDRLVVEYQHTNSNFKYFNSQDDMKFPRKASELLETMACAIFLTIGSLFVGANAVDWNNHTHATVLASFREFRVYPSVFLLAVHCVTCIDVNPEKQVLRNQLMIDFLTSGILLLHWDIV